MPKTYIVAPGKTFYYPADEASLKIVRFARGISKLSLSQRKRVKIKTVTEGEDCSDMPSESLAIFLSRNWVIETSSSQELKEENNV